VLREDDELATVTVRVKHLRCVLKQLGELLPLPINTAAAHLQRLSLQVLEDLDFELELFDRLSGARVGGDLLFRDLELLTRALVSLFKALEVLCGQGASPQLLQQD